MEKETQTESLEDSIFKTLSNQKRRDILRYVGENKEATFTEIKKAAEIDDSSLVSYHLKSLENLIIQIKDKYRLSDLGQEAYNLIVKTNAYTATNIVVRVLRKQLTLLIISNAVLWVLAILSVSYFQESLSRTAQSSLVLLWVISNVMIYTVLRATNQDRRRASMSI